MTASIQSIEGKIKAVVFKKVHLENRYESQPKAIFQVLSNQDPNSDVEIRFLYIQNRIVRLKWNYTARLFDGKNKQI